MVNQKQWTIFLSHSSKDKKFADWLYSKLCSANLSVWYDKYEILIGDSVVQRIEMGLEGSEFLIVILSPESVKSNWVKAELEPKILQQITEQKITILPIVLGKIDHGNISHFLRGKKWIRFSRNGSDEQFRELLMGIRGHLKKENDALNPFGLHGGVEPRKFVIMDRLVREITENITKKQSISIIGARTIGKTSLLKFLSSGYCEPYYNAQSSALKFAFLDLQEHSVKCCDQLLPELAKSLSRSLPQDKFQGNGHEDAKNWIKRKNPGENWVFLIDEFDRIDEIIRGKDKYLFDEYRHLAQHSHLCFLIASRRPLIDFLPESINTSPFFNIFREHVLTVWDETTVRALMFNQCDFFTERDFIFLSRLTGSHPMLLQMGCYHLFNSYRKANKKVDYDDVFCKYINESEVLYRYYWNHEIEDVERKWLMDCLRATRLKDKNTLDNKWHENYTISSRLKELGLILNKSGLMEIPRGFQYFLEKSGIERRALR